MDSLTTADIKDLPRFTVSIRTHDYTGTGIIVTDDGLILTCYHIIKNVNDKAFRIEVYFPSLELTSYATIFKSEPSLDVAFLQLEDKQLLSKQTNRLAVVPLSQEVIPGHDFHTFGFREYSIAKNGLDGRGWIGNQTKLNLEGNPVDRNVIQLYSHEIEKGMSGAAVLDIEMKKVIGVISQGFRKKNDQDNKTLATAFSINTAITVYPSLETENHGLKRIFKFLSKIGEEGVNKYERIDDLYVPPTNYDEIKKALYKNKVLFITGIQEYGKTYTAVYLLWEYFKKGYEPVWFKGAKRKEDRNGVRTAFEDMEKYLKPKHIIYFEDPFGKTEYEVNIDEGINRNIRDIFEIVGDIENAYVIITSREEVFKEFYQRIKDRVNLKKYEKKISAKSPSYTYDHRKLMIEKYATVMNCKWYEDSGLRDIVLDAIRNKGKLSTPLNIQQFARATAKNKVLEEDKLLEKIDEKSMETPISFAEEMKAMSSDKMVFLSFPFLSDNFSVDFVKANYQQLVEELRIEHWEFDRVLDWFKDDKIDIHEYENISHIIFSHPSYSEAIRLAISEDGSLTKVGKTLRSVMFKLADNKITADSVAAFINHNFDVLPENIRNEWLLELVDNKHAAKAIAHVVGWNFYGIDENIRNELILKLADKPKDIVYYAVPSISELPHTPTNELFLKLGDKKHAPLWLRWIASSEQTKRLVRNELGTYLKFLKDLIRNSKTIENGADSVADFRCIDISKQSEIILMLRTYPKQYTQIAKKTKSEIFNGDTFSRIEAAYRAFREFASELEKKITHHDIHFCYSKACSLAKTVNDVLNLI